MGKWFLGGTAAACAALVAFAASAAMASSQAGGVTIKVIDKGQSYVINKSATDSMYFSPATASVKSGQTLTFTYEGKPSQEPHTMSFVAKKDLPTTNAQINACSNGGDMVCNVIAAGHIETRRRPPGRRTTSSTGQSIEGTRASTDPAIASRSRAPSTGRSRSRSRHPPGRRCTSSAPSIPGCTANSRSRRQICRGAAPAERLPGPDSDDGAFASHVVLMWTVSHDTYAFGFHDVSTIKRTLALDLTLADGIGPISA